jgi:hypothetical protein
MWTRALKGISRVSYLFKIAQFLIIYGLGKYSPLLEPHGYTQNCFPFVSIRLDDRALE